MEITGIATACPLCMGGKGGKEVFSVKSETYTGDICSAHIAILLKQKNGKAEPTLFNDRAHA